MRILSKSKLAAVRGTAVAEGPAASGPWHLPLPDASRSAGIMSEPMTAEEIVRYVVSRAVWAPSVHNTQPWRFAADGGPRISLHADVERRLAVADPDGREMMISCGAALFTIRLALRSLGYIPETRVLPDPAQPDLVAQVAWPERADAETCMVASWPGCGELASGRGPRENETTSSASRRSC